MDYGSKKLANILKTTWQCFSDVDSSNHLQSRKRMMITLIEIHSKCNLLGVYVHKNKYVLCRS